MSPTKSEVVIWYGERDLIVYLRHIDTDCDADPRLWRIDEDPLETIKACRTCSFDLLKWRQDTHYLLGRCSLPCDHGVVVCTPMFPGHTAELIRQGVLDGKPSLNKGKDHESPKAVTP